LALLDLTMIVPEELFYELPIFKLKNLTKLILDLGVAYNSFFKEEKNQKLVIFLMYKFQFNFSKTTINNIYLN
jgi:hypothetical protein